MKHASLMTVLLLSGALFAADKDEEDKAPQRLEASREVLEELAGIPEEGVPRDLLDKAECVGIIPSTKKFAFGVGARFGKGVVACRTGGGNGPWGPPLMISLGGGSVGFQIGGQAADYVFLIMNPKGIDNLLKSKFTLGADAAVAAGPKGRTAEAATDARMRAEILTYSRTRGVFAGISLEGAVVSQDDDANRRLYGEKVSPRDLLLEPGQPIPAAARALIAALDKLAPPRYGASASQTLVRERSNSVK
jgi:lipid-binding SYLF domain-containing protein